MSRIKDYRKVNWSELVYYDESSPSGLRWKVDRLNCSNSLVVARDSVAGSLTNYNYWVISNNKTYYKVHRIVWLLLNGELEPTHQIDHFDRDRSNNKISNLRKISGIENRRNISKQQNNTSGVTGVRWSESTKIVKGWSSTYAIAQWNESGNKKIRQFSVKKYGLLEAFALACDYRINKIKELNQLGYGYTDTHGQ